MHNTQQTHTHGKRTNTVSNYMTLNAVYVFVQKQQQQGQREKEAKELKKSKS